VPPTRRRRYRDPLYVWRMRQLNRRLARGRLLVFVGLLLMAVPVAALPLMRVARGEEGPQPITRVPADQPALGLIYTGLVPAKRGAPCVGAYEVGGPLTCSHGPDAPPPGLDVRTTVEAVAPPAATPAPPARDTSPGPQEAEVARDAGSVDAGASAGNESTPAVIPDATPEAAAFTIGAAGVACDGDGQAGKRVQVVYAYEAGTPSRFDQYLPSFRTWSAGVDAIYEASARETGGSRHIRFVTTPACEVDVAEVELPTGGLSTFDKTIAGLKTLGFNRTDRKYMIFADATVYCGIGTFAGDDRVGTANRSNNGPSYGRSDNGCWSAGVAAHELGHNLGAVNNNAPNSSKAGHCVDEYDVMCYRDSSGNATRVVCSDRAHDQRLDCNHDDYYHTSPSPDSYLATHWNVADNQFLINGGNGGGPSPTAPPTTGPTVRPTPGPTTAAPTQGPSPTRTAAPPPPPTTTPGPGPTGPTSGPPSPVPTPTVTPGPAALRVTEIASTSARLAWDAAAAGTRYAVRLSDRTIGVVGVTAVRLVGLRPDRDYTVSIAIRNADGSLSPYAGPVTFHTLSRSWPPARTWVTLSNALTGGAADVFGARSADGTPIVLYRRHDGVNQRWLFEPATADTFVIKAESSGKCLTVAGSVRAGTPLVQQACANGNAAQEWRVVSTPYGFALAAGTSDLVVGVGGIRYRGSRILVLQNRNERRYQSWATS